jgi:hypothetical protein
LIDVTELKTAQARAWELYQIAKENLETAKNLQDPVAFAQAAQAANDAWLEFKKMDAEVTNGVILKNLRDLYHV